MTDDFLSRWGRAARSRVLAWTVCILAPLPSRALAAQYYESMADADVSTAAVTVAAVEKEIKGMKSPHPWAGVYVGFTGITSSALYLAPSGRYCLMDFLDYGPSEFGRCGRVRLQGDRFVGDEGGKPSPGGKRASFPVFLRVPWGGRNYLVPEEDIIPFINEVNEFGEPRYGRGAAGSAHCYLRGAEYDVLVTGRPTLPPAYRRDLLPKPLTLMATSVGPFVRQRNEYHEPGDDDCAADVRFGIGASSGIFVGMELYAQFKGTISSVVIRRVEEKSSSGRTEPFRCKESSPLAAGTPFSSRPLWRAKAVLSAEPMTTEVVRVSTRSFAPFWNGKPQEIYNDHVFDGAAGEGFSFDEIARVKFVGPFPGALEMNETLFRTEQTVLALGGNMVRRLGNDYSHQDEDAGGIESREVLVYCLRYRGRSLPLGGDASFDLPLDLSGPPGKPLSYDWKKAAIKAHAQQCGLGAAGSSARAAGAVELLGWTAAMMRRAQDIRFEDLSPRQREAAARFAPEGTHLGRVWPVVSREESGFLREVNALGDKARADFERRHPSEAEECKKLEEEARRTY